FPPVGSPGRATGTRSWVVVPSRVPGSAREGISAVPSPPGVAPLLILRGPSSREERDVMGFLGARDHRKRWRRTIEARRRLRPAIVTLEDRRLLSTFPVTSAADPATLTPGTLRWAIAQANAATSPSSIEIELGSTPATITLTQGQL